MAVDGAPVSLRHTILGRVTAGPDAFGPGGTTASNKQEIQAMLFFDARGQGWLHTFVCNQQSLLASSGAPLFV